MTFVLHRENVLFLFPWKLNEKNRVLEHDISCRCEKGMYFADKYLSAYLSLVRVRYVHEAA